MNVISIYQPSDIDSNNWTWSFLSTSWLVQQFFNSLIWCSSIAVLLIVISNYIDTIKPRMYHNGDKWSHQLIPFYSSLLATTRRRNLNSSMTYNDKEQNVNSLNFLSGITSSSSRDRTAEFLSVAKTLQNKQVILKITCTIFDIILV